MIKIGALWYQSNGEVLEGMFGDAKIVLMPAKQNSDKSPAYEIYVKEVELRPAPRNYAPVVNASPSAGPDFKIEIGKKYSGKMASELRREDLISYVKYFEDSVHKDGKPLSGKAKDLVTKAKAYLGL